MPDNELRRLRSHLAREGGRLYAGTTAGGLVLTDPQHALLVLGPPRSGKTTGIAIPNALCAPGPVVATSTKMDLIGATLPVRNEVGTCWMFDPSGSVPTPPGVRRLRWSPVAAASTWDESLLVARAITGAARPQGTRGDSAHWTERAEAVVAPLLHAAFLSGAGIDSVVSWVLRQQLEEPKGILALHGVQTASDVLTGIASTDSRELSGIWSSTAGVLAAYRSDAVLDNSSAVNFDPSELLGTSDTVYVCAPARHQDLAAPIVSAFLEQVRSACYSAWARSAKPAPLTVILDEVANIAPLPDLPAMVSEGGSQGLLTVAFLQDLSQARIRWGAAADGFLSLFGSKLVLPGIADMQSLELVSRLGGEVDLPTSSLTRSPWWMAGGETVTWARQRQRRLPVEAVRQLSPGSALLLSGSMPPAHVGIPPWWAVPHLSRSEQVLEQVLEERCDLSRQGVASDPNLRSMT
jgi:type IV secretion system protein VirD4